MKRIAVILILALVTTLGAAAAWRLAGSQRGNKKFITAPVKQTTLISTIGATGTLEPEELVDIGAQVAGQIQNFGKDKVGNPIDYGSDVEEGTVLAQIDASIYQADVNTAKAALLQAQAGQQRAEADLVQMQAKLDQAQRDWNRAQKLGPSQALAPTAYDAYKATFETAQSNVAVDKAAIEQAKALVAESQAALDRAQQNLSYCTIKSPVKGVIIDRRVNIGQTVVSSLNAPSLFLIAKDLHRMQVWVQVNEADIGNIHPGEPVTFTVDAFPGQVFQGQVGKVRLNATMTQNVVTYTVIVTTDNSSGKLLPYLTANVQFETGRHENILAVPNAALRWWPQNNQVAPEFRQTGAPNRGGHPSHTGESSTQQQGTVWVEEGDYVKPIKVTVGLNDGSLTEVQGQGLTQGLPVVVSDNSPQLAANTGGGGASPFTPQLRRSRNNSQPEGSPTTASPQGGR